jgi:hypothetical protein
MRDAKTRFFAFSLAIMGLYGCAGVHWYKAGADEAALTKDLGECRRQAQARLGVNMGPPPSGDPRFGPPPGPSQADRMMQEAQAHDACMREKGYALVPDKK